MAKQILKVAENGASLVEATLTDGQAIISRMYTVLGPASPAPVYQGDSYQAAEVAFLAAAKQRRPG